MHKLLILLSSLLIISQVFAQSVTPVKFGVLDTSVISVEEFMAQKELIVNEQFMLDSVKIIFGGANFYTVKHVDFYPRFDSLNFSNYKKLIRPGSWVTFMTNLKEKNTGLSKEVNLNFVFYSMTRKEFSPPSEKHLEWKMLRNLNYVSGTIYFSGENYNNVVVFNIKGSSISNIKSAFDRCVTGTKITFEKVVFINAKNQTETLNTTFENEY
ncbi:hypothetical protein BH11BAC3_BH11BAC3_20650 [soil metagenome]